MCKRGINSGRNFKEITVDIVRVLFDKEQDYILNL